MRRKASHLERGGSSPTLATLHKILIALNTSMMDFFAEPAPSAAAGMVFRREEMRCVADARRRYTFLLPRRDDVKVEMLDEYLLPGERDPEFETHPCDVGGVVLTGMVELEVEGQEAELLRAGDGMYIPAGRKHRGRCAGAEPARLITVYYPPNY